MSFSGTPLSRAYSCRCSAAVSRLSRPSNWGQYPMDWCASLISVKILRMWITWNQIMRIEMSCIINVNLRQSNLGDCGSREGVYNEQNMAKQRQQQQQRRLSRDFLAWLSDRPGSLPLTPCLRIRQVNFSGLFPCFPPVKRFPALSANYTFSRPFHRFWAYRCSSPVTFSRLLSRFHIFPR